MSLLRLMSGMGFFPQFFSDNFCYIICPGFDRCLLGACELWLHPSQCMDPEARAGADQKVLCILL